MPAGPDARDRASPLFRAGVEHLNARRLLRARRAFSASLEHGERAAPWAAQELVQSFLRRDGPQPAEAALRGLLPPDSALLHHALGYLWRRMGRSAEAEASLETALQRRAGPWAPSCELGWMYCARGEDARGLPLLESAAAAFAEEEDAWGEASATTHLATVAVLRWRLVEADALLARARDLKRRCGDRLGLATVLYYRGFILFSCSRHAEAIDAFEASLDLQRSVRFVEGAAASLNGIGACQLELGNADRATRAFAAALRVYSRVGHDGWRAARAAVRTNLGLACTLRGDRRGASRQLRAALALHRGAGDPDALAVAAASLARHELMRGRPHASLAVLDAHPVTAEDGAGLRSRMMLLTERARASLALGRADDAIRIGRESVGLGEKLPGPVAGLAVQVVTAQVTLGQALLAGSRSSEAQHEIEAAVGRVHEVRAGLPSAMARMGLMETLKEADDAMVRCLLATRDDARHAWAHAAGSKARQLEEALAERREDAGVGLGRIDEIAAEIRHLATSEDLSEGAIERLRDLRGMHAGLEVRDAAPGASPVARRAVDVPRLAPATALLDYHVSSGGSWLFVVYGARVRAIDLGITAAALSHAVERLVAPLRAAGRGTEPWLHLSTYDDGLAASLGRILVDPALELLPRVDRLIISPDGPLHGLPFELLLLRGGRLAETHHASTVPSAMLLREAREPAREAGALVLAWSPDDEVVVRTADGPVRLRPLAAVHEEASAISRLMPGATLLEGAEATSAAYRRCAPGARWIHVTTHGLVDQESWELSAIVVAPEDPRAARADLLTARQIARIPITAELVTLSACDTAVGRLRPREGRLGLVRAFLQAGAESVLASHWAVDDATTRDFMTAFHRGLLAGEDRVVAVSNARRELRRRAEQTRDGRDHPFFWAAFGLSDLRS